MASGVILYQSKYGATKRYADWLTEETGFACMETSQAKIERIRAYDTILLGGGIYASGIAGLSFLKRNIQRLAGKRIAVFCVGASPYDENAFQEICRHNLKDSLGDIPCFYCRGAWDEEKMSFKDRTLCKMLQKAIAKQDPSTYEPWMAALMCAAGQKCDWTDRESLRPLLNYLAEAPERASKA